MKQQLWTVERLETRTLMSVVPNDPYVSKQWNIASESLTQAWQSSTGSKNVVVAVIDSGIDLKHADLVDNIWTNPKEIAGDGIDNDNNGYVDDIHGWNFVNWNGNVQDGYGHGTFVSSIIGAKGNNGLGMTGINWNVSIMALKFMADNGVGYTGAAAYAIEYAVQMKLKYNINIVAINASFGGGTNYNSFLENSIKKANDAGIVFVAAAGNGSNNNDTNPTYPSCYDSPNVISVGALNQDNTLAGYSNYGKVNVDLAAPGSSVYGASPNNNYGYGTGSSFAAPQVAGAVALLNAVKPNISVAEVKSYIFKSVDKLDSLTNKTFTGGKLNVAGAVALAKFGAPVFNTIGVKLGNVEVGTTSLGYAISVDGSIPIQIRNSVGYVSSNNPGGGWAVIGARTIVGGYEVLWKHTSGLFATWAINSSGSFLSSKLVELKEVLNLESQYGVDINGDKAIGLVFVNRGPKLGDVQLGVTQLGYALKVKDGSPILIKYGTTNASDSFPGSGWTAIAARSVSSGYELLWKHTSGIYASWFLNSSGGFLSSRLVSRVELLSMESIYNADIDKDGSVGLLFTSFGAKLDNVEIGVTQLGYAIRNNGGGPILISWSQGYASQNNPGGGWVGISARSTSTGYELFWKNNISGQFAVWYLNSSGFCLSGRLLGLSELLALETKYGVKMR